MILIENTSTFPLHLYLLPSALFSQVSVNTDGSMPDNSAMLEVKASNKGFLLPRLTIAQRDAIANPAAGLNIYNMDKHMMEYYNGSAWRQYSYPSSLEVPCGNYFIDYRNNQVYPTVQIGTQCWMRKNLDIGTYIPSVSTGSFHSDMSNNSTIEKYCYNNDPANCAIYGGLYDWDEMMQYTTTPGTQGICPAGWHIPSDAECCALSTFLDANANCNTYGLESDIAGGKMKETGTTHWYPPNTGATNESGFTALGAGYRYYLGFFNLVNNYAYFWTSSEGSTSGSICRSLNFYYAVVNRSLYLKTLGLSVRCVRNN